MNYENILNTELVVIEELELGGNAGGRLLPSGCFYWGGSQGEGSSLWDTRDMPLWALDAGPG